MQPNWQTLLNKGIIPGPSESWQAFENRAAFLLQAAENEEFKDSLDLVEKIFKMRPSWAVCKYTKEGLNALEAAATFIDEKQRATIHIQPYFQQKKRILFYKRDEIIAHEMVHAIRSAFEEPHFEEFLACRVFSSPWRRFFGSLVEGKRDVILLLIPGVSLGALIFFTCRFFHRKRSFQKMKPSFPLCLTDQELEGKTSDQREGPRRELLRFLTTSSSIFKKSL